MAFEDKEDFDFITLIKEGSSQLNGYFTYSDLSSVEDTIDKMLLSEMATKQDPLLSDFVTNKMTVTESVQPLSVVLLSSNPPILDGSTTSLTNDIQITSLSPITAEDVILLETGDNPSADVNFTDGPCTVTEVIQQTIGGIYDHPVMQMMQLDATGLVQHGLKEDVAVQHTTEDICDDKNIKEIKPETPAPATQVLKKDEKPRKRGRKPKSETGLTQRELRRQKRKMYEQPPMDDEVAEKKRKCAVAAKKHRDAAKAKLWEVTKERDQLKEEVEKLRRENTLLKQQQWHKNFSSF